MQNVYDTTSIRPLDTIEYLAVQIQIYVWNIIFAKVCNFKRKMLIKQNKVQYKDNVMVLLQTYCTWINWNGIIIAIMSSDDIIRQINMLCWHRIAMQSSKQCQIKNWVKIRKFSSSIKHCSTKQLKLFEIRTYILQKTLPYKAATRVWAI